MACLTGQTCRQRSLSAHVSRAVRGHKGCSIQLAVAWQGDRLMMVVVMLLGNTKHSPGTVLSALQIGDLPILQTRKRIQKFIQLVGG